MSLQIIRSVAGEAEYVLLPVGAYKALQPQIDKVVADEYEPFIIDDYVANPVALARIRSCLTQHELAKLMDVSQAYISKLEAQDSITPKILAKVMQVIGRDKK